jgi:hypothetical protein
VPDPPETESEASTPAAATSSAPEALVRTETDAAEYEREQRLLQQKIAAEKAVQQARLEKQRKEEEAEELKLHQERDAERRSRWKRKRGDDDNERSPWIRRVAAAASILVLIYLIGPMAWSYVTARSVPQNEPEELAADVKITAVELSKRFQADAAKAQADFGDRILEVSGTIKEIRPSNTDYLVLVLMDEKNEGRIVCKVPPPKSVTQGNLVSNTDKLALVTLKGKCTGKEGNNVNLEGVQLIQVRVR